MRAISEKNSLSLVGAALASSTFHPQTLTTLVQKGGLLRE